MPKWVHDEWSRLNELSRQTIGRYFPNEVDDDEVGMETTQSGSMSTKSKSTTDVLQSQNVWNETKHRSPLTETSDSRSVDSTQAISLPNVGNSCWINAVVGFLLHRLPDPIRSVLPLLNESINAHVMHNLRQHIFERPWFSDWSNVNDRFDSIALL
jgi:hypothetical protein